MTTGNAVDWFLDRHVREGRESKPAFTDAAGSLTYGALHDATARFAALLATQNIEREQRIALFLQDSIDFPIVFWGALRAGIIPVLINTLLPATQLHDILKDCRAKLLVASPALMAEVAEAAPGLPYLTQILQAGTAPGHLRDQLRHLPPHDAVADAKPDEVAFWLYSSGSTAAPKGVKHLHGSLRTVAENYGQGVLGLRPDDVFYSAAKLFFAYGLGNGMLFPMSVGAHAILHEGRPTPTAVANIMHRHHPSIFGGVPTLYAAMLEHDELGPGAGSAKLRRCLSAGEALPPHIGERWEQGTGVEILDGIGSTEMLHIFISNRPGARRYGTAGLPVPGYDAKLVDDHDNPVPDGEPGHLLVRGDSAAEGYWNNRAKTRATFTGEWVRTGDIFVRDPDGYLRSVGRSDDVFKVSGIWVSPGEIEACLATHEAVIEAAIVPHQDPEGLVKPRAFVVLRPGFTPSDALDRSLKDHVKTHAGPWKYPRWIEPVPELPKTATGKIQRFKLRSATP